MTSPLETCPHCGKSLVSPAIRPTERRLLNVLKKTKDYIDKDELAAAAGRSTEGAFDRTLTEMRKKGLIDRSNGRVRATKAGLALADHPSA